MHVDYIIVGLGLAGLAFAEELRNHNKSFVVFEDHSEQSSLVAAGMYNPVVLKRFNPVWNVQKQLEVALQLYKKLEEQFSSTYDHSADIYRILTSVEEQNNWFAAADKPVLRAFMHPAILSNKNAAIKAPFGFGKVRVTGWIDTQRLLKDYKQHLADTEQLVPSRFDYEKMQLTKDTVNYQEITARKIVFCEGFGLRHNPYFSALPMAEVKGELMTIHAPELQLKTVLKGPVFIQPLGDDFYKVGATFNHQDKTSNPTLEALDELQKKLETMINVTYKVVDQKAGIRPATRDRKPLVGAHQRHEQLAVLNGLGTRGVLLGPAMAKELYAYLELKQELSQEISIARFS